MDSMSTHTRRQRPLAGSAPAMPDTLQASYGDCPDVTTWDRVIGDVYQCRCCKTRQALGDLEVQA